MHPGLIAKEIMVSILGMLHAAIGMELLVLLGHHLMMSVPFRHRQ